MIAVKLAWFVSVLFLLTGFRYLGRPQHARHGQQRIAAGVLLAVLATFALPIIPGNLLLIVPCLAVGIGIGIWRARLVTIQEMPQALALFIGLGGGASALLAFSELLRAADHGGLTRVLAVIGGLAGSVALAGALAARARLTGQVPRRQRLANRQVAYLANITLVLLFGLLLAASPQPNPALLSMYFALSLVFGVTMTMPIATADLPVLVSLYNALTGLAVAMSGYVLQHPPMVIAGALVFAAGTVLTRLMARSANRSLSEMMYSGFGLNAEEPAGESRREDINEISVEDAAASLAFAERVLIAPGYGMAVAQAQHKLRELTQLLEERGVRTGFAVHPVAGRMPGHMNVLLAEAGVPYDRIASLEEINPEFEGVDVVLVVGASDIVNPAAINDERSPLFGMPILEVHRARHVIVLDRRATVGYAGVENQLLFLPATRVMVGDARELVEQLIGGVKTYD